MIHRIIFCVALVFASLNPALRALGSVIVDSRDAAYKAISSVSAYREAKKKGLSRKMFSFTDSL